MNFLNKAEYLLLFTAGGFAVLYLTDLIKAAWMLDAVCILAAVLHVTFAVAALINKKTTRATILFIAALFYIVYCVNINMM